MFWVHGDKEGTNKSWYERLPKHVDFITAIAAVMMAVTGVMALQRYLTAEPAPEIQLQTVPR
jgi:hypothetical protein